MADIAHQVTVQIGNKTVGEGQPVYIVAEVGGNHDGNYDQAVQLINAAADAGADAAKFQLFDPEMLNPGRVTPGSISEDWLFGLQEACWDAGIEFLCSVFDHATLAAYLEVDPPAVKIASPESMNRGLVLAAVVGTAVPLIISTGATTWADLDDLMAELPADAVLLHCVSAYPADPAELNLRCIRAMADRYSVPVGFSDHTTRVDAPMLAVAAGACLIEKHLTTDPTLPGPDHSFAFAPGQFRNMVEAIRSTEQMLGDGEKRVMDSEDATDRRAA